MRNKKNLTWKKILISSILALTIIVSEIPMSLTVQEVSAKSVETTITQLEKATLPNNPQLDIQTEGQKDIAINSAIFSKKYNEQGSNFAIPAPEGAINIALNAKTETSSYEAYTSTDKSIVYYSYSGDNAVDGTINTRWWTTTDLPSEWIIIDLGEVKKLNRIVFKWDITKGSQFVISSSQTKSDVTNMSTISDWKSIKSGKIDDNDSAEFWFDQVQNSRYLKLDITKASNKDSTSVWEFSVYNQSDTYLAKASLTEISELMIPKYIKSTFSLPLTTSFGANVTWTSDKDALKINPKTGVVTVTAPSSETICKLTATIKYQDQPEDTIQFTCIVFPVNQQLIDYKIYPQPQRIIRDGNTANLTNNITLVVKDNSINEKTKKRAKDIFAQHGYTLNVSNTPSTTNSSIILDIYSETSYPTFKNSAIAKDEGGITGKENIFDAHIISVSKNLVSKKADISIVGKHNNAVYYALASIDQMLDQIQSGSNLSTVVIEDYSNSKYRGVTEGFYGYPYSNQDIESLIKFGQKYKMNTFMYGPKADPYHTGKWKQPYPTESTITTKEREQGILTQEQIKNITKVADECNIDFVWSIHPMMEASNRIDISDPTALSKGVEDIIAKYELMYALGVKSFGLFVDDLDLSQVSVLPLAPQQAQLIGDVTSSWKEKYPNDFKPIFYVPSLYCFASYWPIHHLARNWTPLSKLNNIDDIVVTFTGADVFAPIQNDSFFAASSSLDTERKYKLALWWNSPVNDSATNSLFMGPANQQYDMYKDVTDSLGIMSNPMCQAEASKVQLFGLLDYSWNISDFNANRNWEDSFEAIIGNDLEMIKNFKIFAQNSAPAQPQDNTDKPSITYSGIDEAVEALLENRSSANFDALTVKLTQWKDACLYLDKNLPNSNNSVYEKLHKEIKPWINKALSIIGLLQDCIDIASGKNNSIATFYNLAYVYANMPFDPNCVIQTMAGTGEDVSTGTTIASIGGEILNTFIPVAYEWAYNSLKDELPKIKPHKSGIIANIETNGITFTSHEKGFSLNGLIGKEIKSEEYIGIAFMSIPTIGDLSDIVTLLPDGIELQYSTGGTVWYKYTVEANKQPIIAVRLFNTSQSSVFLTQNELEIPLYIMPSVNNISTTVPHYQDNVNQRIIDRDWKTFYWTDGNPSNSVIQIDYTKTFDLKNLKLVFSTGDKLNAVTKVDVSNDGQNWKTIAILNGDDIGAIQPQIITKDEENYQIYSIYGIDNISISYIRLTLDKQAGGSWLKVHEIIPNDGDSPSIVASSGKNTDAILDSTIEKMYIPNIDTNDSITCNLVNPLKINTIDVYMKPNETASPKAEIKIDGKWTTVLLTLKDEYHYTIDISNLMDVTDLRLSWRSQNRPYSIYEISY